MVDVAQYVSMRSIEDSHIQKAEVNLYGGRGAVG